MKKKELYDNIGARYTAYRQADPRLTEAILLSLDLPLGSTVADIGAGTGNYSFALAQKGYLIKAIEPSITMRRQGKLHSAIGWTDGTAENIPLHDGSVDASVAILSFHHINNDEKALEEMARISKAGLVLLFTFDPRLIERPWLAHYFPFLWDDTFKHFPPILEVASLLGNATKGEISIHTFELPHDLSDCFAAAGWRRPEIYLNPTVRACMSGFATADQRLVENGVQALRRDLDTGAWDGRYGDIKKLDSMDMAYRFVLSQPMA